MDVEEAIELREKVLEELNKQKKLIEDEISRNEYHIENLKRLRILTERGLEYDA